MLKLLRTRLLQGHQTSAFRRERAQLPAQFRGRPILDEARCTDNCRACADACPTDAIATSPLRLDLGKCVFCTACQDACPDGAIRFTNDPRLSSRTRTELVLDGDDDEAKLATALDAELRRVFGGSLKLRQVSAGGGNGGHAELAASCTDEDERSRVARR